MAVDRVDISPIWSICAGMPLRRIHRQMHALFQRTVMSDALFHDGLGVCVGLSNERDPRSYHWDGMKRGGDPRHPLVLIQYTLAGWGWFQTGPAGDQCRPQRVDPGNVFITIIPSEHRYWLPPASTGWTSVWAIMHHPYAVPRLAQALDGLSRVMPLAADGEVVASFLRMVDGVVHRRFADPFLFEGACFDLTVTMERHLHQLRHPRNDREIAIAQVRAMLQRQPQRFIAVEELAAYAGQTRTAYSKWFRQATGLTPAAVILQIRLEGARQSLAQGDEPLATVAKRCGFTNANHFCKVFRRQFHLSPGQYRRQRRGGSPA